MENVKKYCQVMEEIKTRVNIVLNFFDKGLSTGSDVTDVEFICLQVRKILELVVLASIAPNKEEYSKIREKFEKDWKVRLIMKDIERINPNFYPKPIKMDISESDGEHYHFDQMPDGYLTKIEFLNVHGKCGGILHADNPYGTPGDLSYIKNHYKDWIKKIMMLLHTHCIRLVDDSKVWIINMKVSPDNKVHAYVATGLKKVP